MNLFDALQKYPLQTALKGCGLSLGAYRRARLDPDFSRQADAAIAAREAELVDVVRMATTDDWQAAKFLLERTAGYHEVKETRAVIQLEIERLLDALEPHLSPGAFGELLQALALISGAAPPRVLPLAAEGT